VEGGCQARRGGRRRRGLHLPRVRRDHRGTRVPAASVDPGPLAPWLMAA